MNAVSPIIKGLEGLEVKFGGEDVGQPEYNVLPVLGGRQGQITSRWTFTEQERKDIAEGADVFLTLYTKHSCPPTRLEVLNAGQLEAGVEYFLNYFEVATPVPIEDLKESLNT